MITDEQLKAYHLEGLIPGPQENEENFLERVNYCLSLKNTLTERLGEGFPLEAAVDPDPTLWQKAWQTTEQLYGIRPTWVPLFYSNYQLPFWQGGCAWIFQQSEDAPTSALLQLRQAFRKDSSYLGLYGRDELLAHEISHIGRMAFEEPQFEELLAYRSSPSSFRRFLGPLIQSPSESALFMLILLLIFFLDAVVLWFQPALFTTIAWLKLIPLGLIGWAFYRLLHRQRTLQKTLANLTAAYGNEANAVLFRLTDEEIRRFANMTPLEILTYAQDKRITSLRWRFN